MAFSGFGVVASSAPDPRSLDRCLGEIVDMGFTHAELPIEKWGVFADCRVVSGQLARFAKVADRWRDRLRFTVHGPFAFWALAHDEPDQRERMLQAAMEATRAFGAELMVYDTFTFRRPWPGEGLSGLESAAARERGFLQAAADDALAWGGMIAIETSDDDSFAGWPDRLAEQVVLIDRPNVGLCIDTGHSLTASTSHQWDYIDGMSRLAPHTITFHLEDNFGRANWPAGAIEGDIQRFELGIGDLHLPPGWAAVPFERLFGEIDFPRGPIMMLEIDYDAYRDVLPEQLEQLRRWAEMRTGS